MVAQMVKRLPAMRETWVRFLGQEDPLEKEMAIHSSTLAWKIPWTEEPDRPQSVGSQGNRRETSLESRIFSVVNTFLDSLQPLTLSPFSLSSTHASLIMQLP